MKNKDYLIFIGFILVIVIIFLLIYKGVSSQELSGVFYDNNLPGVFFNVTVNKRSGELKGKFTHTCDTKDCEPSIFENKIIMTDEEYKHIIALWDKKEVLFPIIENLCLNEKEYIEVKDSSDNYKVMDINEDGIVSYRELGDFLLYNAYREIIGD